MPKLMKFFVLTAIFALLFTRISIAEEDISASAGGLQNTGEQVDTYLKDESTSARDETTKQTTQEKIAQNKERFKDRSFIGSKNWKGDGSIVGNRDNKYNLVAGDTVYTSLGSYEVKEGTQCDVFRRIAKVKDPHTGRYLGYEIRHLGVVEIIGNVGIDTSLAKIVNSTDTMMVGDLLKVREK